MGDYGASLRLTPLMMGHYQKIAWMKQGLATTRVSSVAA